MLAFRQPTSREERREWWRRQISRQQSANLSVAEFCRQLGISVTTFYYWKRRVEEAPGTAPGLASAEHPSQHPTAPAGTAVANFVPVSILDPGAGTQLEIELTNACVVRLRGVVDPPLLQAAITAAGQVGGSRQGVD
jgi:transposase-like protein